MRTHYAPDGGSWSWCGRPVGFHNAVPATKLPERVTCRSCLRSMRKYAKGVASWDEATKRV